MMENFIWHYKVLQKSDLPIKAQKIIDLLEIAIDTVEMLHLEADTNGNYIKDFRDAKICGRCELMNRIIYLINNVKVGTTIHELMHVYIHDNDIDTQAIAEAYMAAHPKLGEISNYGLLSYYEKQYDETVCEIVAMYGRRGQFNKISELFNI